MRLEPRRWATYVVLMVGVALRVATALVMLPEQAYDDHYSPVRIILEKGRVPRAENCWECFQPPLYHFVAAGAFKTAERIAHWAHFPEKISAAIGRKAIQFVSVVAGVVTLWLCLLILRRVSDPPPALEAIALAFVALLPRHIYMSAMCTNDAFTYLLATLALYVALRVHAAGWPTRGCLLTGVLAGATVLSKGYGLVTVIAIVATVGLFALLKLVRTRGRGLLGALRPVVLVFVAALFIGAWPTVRNLVHYGRVHVDNYDKFKGPMRSQPPGSLEETSFLSFRLPALLRRPWVHMSYVDSFWTALYARLWFDHEGFSTSLIYYPGWRTHWQECARLHPIWDGARERLILDYPDEAMPPDLRRIAVVAYLAGLPLTLGVLVGFGLALRWFGRDFARTLLTVHLIGAVWVPVFQTLRLPVYAAMKTAFALSGIATVPVLACLVLGLVRGVPRAVVIALLAAALAVIAGTEGAYVWAMFRYVDAAIGPYIQPFGAN